MKTAATSSRRQRSADQAVPVVDDNDHKDHAVAVATPVDNLPALEEEAARNAAYIKRVKQLVGSKSNRSKRARVAPQTA